MRLWGLMVCASVAGCTGMNGAFDPSQSTGSTSFGPTSSSATAADSDPPPGSEDTIEPTTIEPGTTEPPSMTSGTSTVTGGESSATVGTDTGDPPPEDLGINIECVGALPGIVARIRVHDRAFQNRPADGFRFVTDVGAPLPFELREYDPSTGEVDAWVRLTSNQDVHAIQLQSLTAGGPAPTPRPSPWADHCLRWSFDTDDLDPGFPLAATPNSGTVEASGIDDGVVGPAGLFDGTERLEYEYPQTCTSEFSAYGWLYVNDGFTGDAPIIAQNGTPVPIPNIDWGLLVRNNEIVGLSEGDDDLAVPLERGQWIFVGLRAENSTLTLFVNDEVLSSPNGTVVVIENNNDHITLGGFYENDSVLTPPLEGRLDEFVVTPPHPNAWFDFVRDNQMHPEDTCEIVEGPFKL